MDPVSTIGSLLSNETIRSLRGVYIIEGTDNATTDAASLSAARTALLAEGGGTIYFNGTLNLSSVGTFLMGSSTIPLGLVGLDNKATLRYSGDPDDYLYWGHLVSVFPSNNKIDGTVVTKQSPLTTIDNYRWWQFNSNDADDLSEGDWIYVWTEASADRLNEQVACQNKHHTPGYFVQVRSVDNTLVSLNHQVPDYMTTLWIHKRDVAMGPISVGNFRVVCDSPEVNSRSLQFRSCVDVFISDITYEKNSLAGIGISGCADIVIKNIKHGGLPDSIIDSSSCVVAVTASNGVLIDGLKSFNFRHHFDTSAVPNVADDTRVGTNWNVTVSNWTTVTQTDCLYNITYTGGTGTIPNVGDLITWTSPLTNQGRVVSIVSGNATAGVIRIRRESTKGGPGTSQTVSGAATSWSATVSSVSSPTQYGAPFSTHEGDYGTRFINCVADVSTDSLNFACFLSRSRNTQYIGCRVFGSAILYGFQLQGAKNEVIDCEVNAAFIGVWIQSSTSTSTNQTPQGDNCVVKGSRFTSSRNAIILDGLNALVEGNAFAPAAQLNSSGGYNYAPITVRASKTGQRILHNSFVRGTNEQGAIWCEEADLIAEIQGNTFSGYTSDPGEEGPATAEYPFHIGASGSTTNNTDLFDMAKGRNLGLVELAEVII